jgi:hypothetical protein
MIGVWEMGRVVFAQQIVVNAAREGARLAAQGRTVSEIAGTHEVTIDDVMDTVYQSLVTSGLEGLDRSDVTITFQFLPPFGKNGNGPEPTQPYNAEKLQRFRISVSVPYDKVRIVNLGLVNPTKIAYSVDWFVLVDDEFRVNETIPSW